MKDQQRSKPDERMTLGPLTLELTLSSEHLYGVLHVPAEECSIVMARDGKRIGHVIACVGGGVELRMDDTPESWFLSFKTLWDAFEIALAARAERRGEAT